MAELRYTGTLRIDGSRPNSAELLAEIADAIDAALSRIPNLYREQGQHVIEVGSVHLFEPLVDVIDTIDLAKINRLGAPEVPK